MDLIVCIPGPWQSHAELIAALTRVTEGGYLFAGRILMAMQSNETIEAELCPADPRMQVAFAVPRLKGDASAVAAISNHRGVLYLTTRETGLDRLHVLHAFINACLAAGGLGVKFENSGTAHLTDEWHGMQFHQDRLGLLRAHVMLVTSESHLFSCGMHIFALRDCAVAGLPSGAAGYLLTEFNHYHLFEGPTFRDGQTFGLPDDPARYRLRLRDDFLYGDDQHFGNPHGRIELVPIT